MQIPKLLLKVVSQITQQVPLATKLYAICIITVFAQYFTQFGTEKIFIEMKTKIFKSGQNTAFIVPKERPFKVLTLLKEFAATLAA